MLKYTTDDKTCRHQLEESLNSMLEMLRNVNNIPLPNQANLRMCHCECVLYFQEMLKYTKDDKTCQHQLEESLNSMLEVVRIVNNSMYEISIVAFQVSVSNTLCIQ